jgi:ABC-type lipoprotein export system ATPase subunit
MDDKQRKEFEKELREKAEKRQRAEQASALAHERQLIAHDRPQDTLDPRAKNSGHGKKTADKWNQ